MYAPSKGAEKVVPSWTATCSPKPGQWDRFQFYPKKRLDPKGQCVSTCSLLTRLMLGTLSWELGITHHNSQSREICWSTRSLTPRVSPKNGFHSYHREDQSKGAQDLTEQRSRHTAWPERRGPCMPWWKLAARVRPASPPLGQAIFLPMSRRPEHYRSATKWVTGKK